MPFTPAVAEQRFVLQTIADIGALGVDDDMLDAVLDTIARSVLRRSLVKFRGFGSFSIKRRRARVVRHPENGSKLFVHESSTMKFRPSSRLWKK